MSMFTPPGVGGNKKRVRRRGRRRSSRVGLVLLLVLATAVGLYWFVLRDTGADTVTAKPGPSCPAASPTPSAAAASQVRVNVYNATEERGLASKVADQLRKRGFHVGKVDNDPAKRTVTGVAEVRSSKVGTAAARTVGAQVYRFVTVPDQRPDATVDLVLGVSFKALRSTEQASAALSPTSAPKPSGC
jgi:hypothetical protein